MANYYWIPLDSYSYLLNRWTVLSCYLCAYSTSPSHLQISLDYFLCFTSFEDWRVSKRNSSRHNRHIFNHHYFLPDVYSLVCPVSVGSIQLPLVTVSPCPRVPWIKSQVLGAGVEPAYLSAPEPKSGVSAIPPPEQPAPQTFYCSRPSGKRFAI